MVSEARQELALKAFKDALEAHAEVEEILSQLGFSDHAVREYPKGVAVIAEELESKATQLAQAARRIVDALS